MDIFLIDFENVKSEGLNGILNLAKTDLVCVFWSLKEDKLKIETTEQLMKCQVPVYFYKADVGGKNALDHQLSSYLGYLIGKGSDAHYYIISNDKGYRFLADFWKRMKVEAPIELAPSIKAVKIRQQQQQQKQTLFNEPRIERIAQKEAPKLLPVKEIVALPLEPEAEEIPEVPVVTVEETVTPASDNTTMEPSEERPSRKKRRGHRSRRRPKTTADAAAETTILEDSAVEDHPAPAQEDLPDTEAFVEIPMESVVEEASSEAESLTDEDEITDAEVLLELPSEEVLEIILSEETAETVPSDEVSVTVEPVAENSEETTASEEMAEETTPKKSRNRSSRNRRSRAKKNDAENKAEETIGQAEASPVSEAEKDPIPAEETVEQVPEDEVVVSERKPAKHSRKKTTKKIAEKEEAVIPAQKPEATSPQTDTPSVKESPDREPISMETLVSLIPDSAEETWMSMLLEDINRSHNKKELYAKVIRHLKQEHGREVYHKIKKLVP